MAIDFTTTALLASLKRRGLLPSTDEALATSDFLALADEVIQSYLVPLLLSVREEFLVTNYDITTVANQAAYGLPPRAVGRELRNVLWYDGATYYPLSRIDPEREYDMALLGGTSSPVGYKFENDSIVLLPTPAAGGTCRLQYFIRPNKLVQTSSVATISSIDAGRTVITTTATIPSSITTGILIDIVDNNPGFTTLAMDYTTTATTSGTTITVTTALPSSVAAGDYVCYNQESPVAQLPVEMFPLLAERVCFEALKALGDPKAGVSAQECDRLEKEVIKLLSPRSQGSARPIVPRYGPGIGRGFRWTGSWRY